MARKKKGTPVLKLTILVLLFVAAMFVYRNFDIEYKGSDQKKIEKVAEAVGTVLEEEPEHEAQDEQKAGAVKDDSEKQAAPKKFKPSGDTDIEVGLSIKNDRKRGNRLVEQGHTFRADKKTGLKKVYAFAHVREKNVKKVYFQFVSDAGEEKRSSEYDVSYNPNGYKVYVWNNLPRGRWKAHVKDAATDVSLDFKGFMIR